MRSDLVTFGAIVTRASGAQVRGQVVKAFVVLKDAATPGLVEEIQNLVRENLSRHEYPRHVEIVTELPKTPAGKVNRKILRDNAAKAAA